MLRQSIDPEELYQGAMDAIAEGQWTIAQHLLIQLKTISPGNSDLEPLLAFVNNSIKASQEMSVENQKSIQSDDLETKSIELPKDDEVILESDEIESLTDNEMISSEGEIEIHEESQIDEIEYVLPHEVIPSAIESETLDETQEDELEFVQPYEANQSAENIEGKLENQDEFDNIPSHSVIPPVIEPDIQEVVHQVEILPIPLDETLVAEKETQITTESISDMPISEIQDSQKIKSEDALIITDVEIQEPSEESVEDISFDDGEEPEKALEIETEVSSIAPESVLPSISKKHIASPKHSEETHTHPGNKAEIEEFLQDLQDAMDEEGIPAEQGTNRAPFRITRRWVISLICLALFIFCSLAYLGNRFSSSGKPLTMVEKFETMTPPTPTFTLTYTPFPTYTSTLPEQTSTPFPPTGSPTLPPPSGTPSMMPTLGIHSEKISLQDGMAMVYVPEGDFFMGPTNRKVYLNAFWIDKTEVTNAMFLRCVEARVCPPPVRDKFKDQSYANHPVIWVNWFQSFAYCRWVGRRLPTEAEWEKGARGTDGRLYPWGDQEPSGDMVNICDKNCGFNWNDKSINDGYAQTVPVGSYMKGASPYGALDMAGNVWEWTANWFDDTSYYAPPTANPLGAKFGDKRVIRGGSWNDLFEYIQTTHRSKLIPAYSLYNIGFRCVSAPK